MLHAITFNASINKLDLTLLILKATLTGPESVHLIVTSAGRPLFSESPEARPQIPQCLDPHGPRVR